MVQKRQLTFHSRSLFGSINIIKNQYCQSRYIATLAMTTVCPGLDDEKHATERETCHNCALSISLSAVRFRTPLGAGFSDKYHISPLSILGHCFDVVSLGEALNPQMLHLTQVKMSTCKDRDDNVYDKLNAPKWLQFNWHTNEQAQCTGGGGI